MCYLVVRAQLCVEAGEGRKEGDKNRLSTQAPNSRPRVSRLLRNDGPLSVTYTGITEYMNCGLRTLNYVRGSPDVRSRKGQRTQGCGHCEGGRSSWRPVNEHG